MTWAQVYDPTGSMLLSTILAALPVIVLLGAIGIFEMKAHLAALLGLVSALLIAILVFGMPTGMAVMSAVYGAGFGLWPIGWIILNVIFLYQLTNEKGEFDVLQRSIRDISDDRRLQLLFIAFCFGAFFEGAAGFGTPVAVTRRHADRARLLAARRLRPLADRQHRPGGLRRARHAGDRARRRHRARSPRAQRHDRPPAALLLGHRPDLADLGLRRLPPHARSLPGPPRRRHLLRHPAISRLQLPRPLARRRRRRHRLDGLPRPLPARLASQERHDRGAARLVVQGSGRRAARAPGRRHLARGP